ncbi:MAG: hypothetical protein ACRCVX_14680 [Shewanella sp.]
MIGTLLSFFGGTAFRMLWGEISAMITARQEHKFEVERMRIQAELDLQAHTLRMESMRFQAEMGVKEIQVKGESDLALLDAETFSRGVELTGKSTGFWLIDGWNASIRAAAATMMLVLIALDFNQKGWVLDARGWELAGAVLGLYLADRMLFRRGK